jgi:hypothetical protein
MLPQTYQRWLGDWLAAEIPREEHATCDTCAMSPPPGTPQTQSALADYYGANKCCTYFPSLPNFQVGNILRDGELADGAQRVAAVIGNRTGTTPIYLHPDRKRSELYRIGSRAGFGRADAFRCPYFIQEGSGGCSIWRHRESVCSTFYCKFNRPVKGREFWEELKGLLVQLERTVAVHCALELGISGAIIDELLDPTPGMRTAADVDGRADDELHARLWGSWLGREDAFYIECAQRSDALDLAAIRRLGGMTVERRLDAVRKAFDALLSTAVPTRLRVAPSLHLGASKPGKVRLIAGPNQPIEMSVAVLEVLSYFQGQPVDETKATLVEQGFALENSFVEKLWSYGFLVEATD